MRIKAMPEIAGVSENEKKAAIRACRWKPFKHWQYWLSFILYFLILPVTNIMAGSIFFIIMVGFNLITFIMMFVIPLITVAFLFYTASTIHQYYLSPYLHEYVRSNHPESIIVDDHPAIQKKRKKVLFISIPVLLLVLSIYGIVIKQLTSYKPRQMPTSLKDPRVEINTVALMKSQALQVAGLGKISDIVKLRRRSSDATSMVIAGSQGAVLTDDRLSVRKTITFDGDLSRVSVIQGDPEGSPSYISRGSWANKACLIDATGKKQWSYSGPGTGIDDMTAGDLKGDGTIEYVVGFNGGGGVHLLNADGKKIWAQSDGNVWHVEIVDIDGEGSRKIVHSNAAGKITIRDADGKILSIHKPQTYFSHFSIIDLPEKNRPYLLQNSDEQIWVLDMKGKAVRQLPAPLSCDGHAKGTMVKLDKDTPYLAVIADQYIWSRSVLFVYNAADQLVYHEILPGTCYSIFALQSEVTSQQSFLIGCENIVWRYEVRQQ